MCAAAAEMWAVVGTPGTARRCARARVAVPEPGPDEVLVAVRAFALNRGELTLLAHRNGGWRPGQDLAGVVARVAADGSGPPAGARVVALADSGGWAQYVAVPAARVATLPDGVGFAEAAALPIAGTTALNLIRAGGSLLARRVLITGASGGVGGFATQLAALAGAEVVALVGTPHAGRLAGYGAACVVPRIEQAGGGFDLVLDSVGGPTLTKALMRVRPGGTVVCFGNSSHEPARLDFLRFTGCEDARVETFFSYRHEHLAAENLRVLLGLLAGGRLAVELGFAADWERVNDALDALAERRFGGKAVLSVAEAG